MSVGDIIADIARELSRPASPATTSAAVSRREDRLQPDHHLAGAQAARQHRAVRLVRRPAEGHPFLPEIHRARAVQSHRHERQLRQHEPADDLRRHADRQQRQGARRHLPGLDLQRHDHGQGQRHESPGCCRTSSTSSTLAITINGVAQDGRRLRPGRFLGQGRALPRRRPVDPGADRAFRRQHRSPSPARRSSRSSPSRRTRPASRSTARARSSITDTSIMDINIARQRASDRARRLQGPAEASSTSTPTSRACNIGQVINAHQRHPGLQRGLHHPAADLRACAPRPPPLQRRGRQRARLHPHRRAAVAPAARRRADRPERGQRDHQDRPRDRDASLESDHAARRRTTPTRRP